MARILAVADAFDAMASDRQYRAGMSLKKVDEILRSGSGRQWCPDVIHAYTTCRADLIQIWLAGQSSKNCDEHRA
jgi:HD-GYP domain-containing protein (c-di-GMP phosphodiesterase class II)